MITSSCTASSGKKMMGAAAPPVQKEILTEELQFSSAKLWQVIKGDLKHLSKKKR
jgi:hypothetical protein